ncbi:MAG: restriction endonuclease [Lachnospiraceae bacterium]|nr:restriction endonuclease [Lachnospiraceae bacterium]
MTKDYLLYLIIFLVIVINIYLLIRLRKRNIKPLPMDEMEGHDFEYYCADLLKNDGFLNVEVTKGSGDFGVDILAERDGISYAFQCKCYDKPIGVKAVQEIYAGRDYYNRMVGVVITNQYYTQPAVELAEKLKIVLWDRDYIELMDNGPRGRG